MSFHFSVRNVSNENGPITFTAQHREDKDGDTMFGIVRVLHMECACLPSDVSWLLVMAP